MKRRVRLWLVSDHGGEWEDAWSEPVIAFQSEADARECAAKRRERNAVDEDCWGVWDYIGSDVKEIDAVLEV